MYLADKAFKINSISKTLYNIPAKWSDTKLQKVYKIYSRNKQNKKNLTVRSPYNIIVK